MLDQAPAILNSFQLNVWSKGTKALNLAERPLKQMSTIQPGFQQTMIFGSYH